jgi:predicted  nucleic acid-binding Zn-ribbon protein
MRLEKERNMAEQNTLKINVDRLQQQVKDAEEEIDRSRKELQAVCDRYERECDQFRSDSQYKTQHYENLIREIKQTSAQEEAVRIKAELAEKLSQQYEQRLAAVRT